MCTSEVKAGARMPVAEFGPLTIIDTVRWAGFQENWTRLHYDRNWVKDHARLPTFIASGEYRQALLLRALMLWAGPRGAITRFRIRHIAPTHEGDVMRFHAEVEQVIDADGFRFVECTVEGRNQNEKPIMTGECKFRLLYT